MYEFVLKNRFSGVYDIYRNNERIRDENDFCVRIDEKKKQVAFYNAYTAHMLVNVVEIIPELLEILKMIDEGPWKLKEGYDYQINKVLREELNKYN